MKKKRSTVPVFLIYAGIIHAIGLALLLPMLITLPGTGTGIAPKTTAIDVEIVPAAPSASKIEQDEEQTSALPSAALSASEGSSAENEAEAASEEGVLSESAAEAADANTQAKPATGSPAAVANVGPEVQPESAEAQTTEEEAPKADVTPEKPKVETKAKAETARAAKAAPASAKKPLAQHKKVARAASRRPAKTATKIAPFNGALSGLFSPAPAPKGR